MVALAHVFAHIIDGLDTKILKFGKIPNWGRLFFVIKVDFLNMWSLSGQCSKNGIVYS